MDKNICSVPTVCFIFTAALHLEAVVQKESIYYPSIELTWEKARLHCQKKNVDLITIQEMNTMTPEWAMHRYNLNTVVPSWPMQPNLTVLPLWTGLVRHPEDAAVWKEVSFKTGGLSGDNVSQSIKWDNTQMEPLCAFVSETDQMWHSDMCSNKKHFYCSFNDEIKYFKIAQSWYNASDYCQNFSGDLVSVYPVTAHSLNKTGWIGGFTSDDIWKWVGNFTPSVTKWAPNEPQSKDCVAYNLSSKTYLRTSCSERLHPLCLNDNLLVVKKNKTWEEALNYCLSIYLCKRDWPSCKRPYTLLSLDKESDYNYIRDRIYRASTTEVWIGLRFLGGSWWWVDGHRMDQTWTLPSCPSKKRHCGTLSKYGTKNWIIRDCSEKRNFICYRN